MVQIYALELLRALSWLWIYGNVFHPVYAEMAELLAVVGIEIVIAVVPEQSKRADNIGRSFLGLVVGARSALTGEKLSLDISDSQKEKVIEKCMEYNTLCNSAKDASKALEEDLKSFGTNYESDFSEEVDNLNSWCIESSLYTEFSMTPSGTMSNYANQNSTYHDNLNRFQKIAESYINDVA